MGFLKSRCGKVQGIQRTTFFKPGGLLAASLNNLKTQFVARTSGSKPEGWTGQSGDPERSNQKPSRLLEWRGHPRCAGLLITLGSISFMLALRISSVYVFAWVYRGRTRWVQLVQLHLLWFLACPKLKTNSLTVATAFLVKKQWGSYLTLPFRCSTNIAILSTTLLLAIPLNVAPVS